MGTRNAVSARLSPCAWSPARRGPLRARFRRAASASSISLPDHDGERDRHILGNPNAPFIDAQAKQANQATNYFAAGAKRAELPRDYRRLELWAEERLLAEPAR
jgi:hypothetical protein